MKKQLLFLLSIFFCVEIYAQNDDLWQKVTSGSALSKSANATNPEILYYKLNVDFLARKLSGTTSKTSKNASVEITVPNVQGVLEKFSVWESSNFDSELQAKYPEIRAYEGRGIDDKAAKLHFSLAPAGLQTMIFRSDKATEFVEQNPYNKSEYMVFVSKNSLMSKVQLECKTVDKSSNKKTSQTSKIMSSAKVFKTLRLALSCTGEYTAFYGGTKAGALAGMNATMTRVNGVYNRDLAVKLIMIANTDAVIYTDAKTDPYSDAENGTKEDKDEIIFWSKELQGTLTKVIGESNYDIGHLFAASGGGGNAGCIGCVCESPTESEVLGKGSGYTSPSDSKPQGDAFDIDFVCHEMGHQLGANHTFSHDKSERSKVNVEPGSGSTIMGYAGITDYNVQDKSDDYFSYASIYQIQDNLGKKTCPSRTPLTKSLPVVDAGKDYTIPFGTAFVLEGTGSNTEESGVTYTWEELDNATSTSGATSIAYPTKPDGPLFRSFPPSSSLIRYMPSLSSVLQNKLTTKWESVSSIARTLNFVLTARDNGVQGTAQTNTSEMSVTVASFAGPFTVTSHNKEDISWQQGSSQTIKWNVNNTNTLFGSSAVNIKLSTDGGLTFPIILAANTPNDGSEVITLPTSVPISKNCRILIEPTDNIYYAVNSVPFAVGYTTSTTCDSFSFGTSFSIPQGEIFEDKNVIVPKSNGGISDVSIAVNITHERFSDVTIIIRNPQGKTLELFNNGCDNAVSTLALNFNDAGNEIDCKKTTEQIVIPVNLLSAFKDQNPEGTWTLEVRDTGSGKLGKINSASIDICTQSFTLGTDDFENINFELYPNPNKGSFTIQFANESNTVKVFVHDILGKNIYSKSFETSGDFNQNIQLPNVVPGMYLVTVVDGNRRTVKKILVN